MIASIQARRFAIIATLATVALGLWAWKTWQGIERLGQARRQQEVMAIFDTMESTLRALEQTGQLSDDQMQDVLNRIGATNPLWFVIVQRDGMRVLETKGAPATLSLSSAEGESFDEGRFLVWRGLAPVSGIGDDEEREPSEGSNRTTDSILDTSGGLMILGGEVPQDRRAHLGALRGMLVSLFVAILFVSASLVAWSMTIRSRLLAEQLETERVRLAHMEELGLAAAGLAHETKNPLGIIRAIAQRLAGRPDEPTGRRVMIEQIIDEVDNASARLGHFMVFARQREIEAMPVDVAKACAKVAEVLQSEFAVAGVTLEN